MIPLPLPIGSDMIILQKKVHEIELQISNSHLKFQVIPPPFVSGYDIIICQKSDDKTELQISNST